MTAASGYGLLTLHGDTVLDAWFPSPVLGATEGGPSEELAHLDGGKDDLRGVTREVRLVEIDDTQRIFTNPSEKRTEDYITGRFG